MSRHVSLYYLVTSFHLPDYVDLASRFRFWIRRMLRHLLWMVSDRHMTDHSRGRQRKLNMCPNKTKSRSFRTTPRESCTRSMRMSETHVMPSTISYRNMLHVEPNTIRHKTGEGYNVAQGCRDPGSNQGPSRLQSDALSTELPRPRRAHTPRRRKLIHRTTRHDPHTHRVTAWWKLLSTRLLVMSRHVSLYYLVTSIHLPDYVDLASRFRF